MTATRFPISRISPGAYGALDNARQRAARKIKASEEPGNTQGADAILHRAMRKVGLDLVTVPVELKAPGSPLMRAAQGWIHARVEVTRGFFPTQMQRSSGEWIREPEKRFLAKTLPTLSSQFPDEVPKAPERGACGEWKTKHFAAAGKDIAEAPLPASVSPEDKEFIKAGQGWIAASHKIAFPQTVCHIDPGLERARVAGIEETFLRSLLSPI